MNMLSVSMENLFLIAGYDYRSFLPNTWVDIKEKNIFISCYDHKTKEKTKKKILKLIRKEDSLVVKVHDLSDKLLLKATGYHRVYNPKEGKYIRLKDATDLFVLTQNNEWLPVVVEKTDEIFPILDIEVEDEANYFSNSILSHNTTPGGEAMKFYASQRLDIRKGEAINDGEDRIGNVTTIKVIKNKVGRPFQEVKLNIKFGKGIDKSAELVELAFDAGLLERKGAWFSLHGTNIGQGVENTCTYLNEHPEVAEELRIALSAPPSIVPDQNLPVPEPGKDV